MSSRRLDRLTTAIAAAALLAAVAAGFIVLRPRAPKYDGLESLRASPYNFSESVTSLSGVTHRSERAAPGYNLFTNNVDEAYLMDLDGKILHTWRFPSKKIEFCKLLPRGRLAAVGVHHGFFIVDWDSNPVLTVTPRRFHHEIEMDADGRFLVPLAQPVIRYGDASVVFHTIVRIAANGKFTPLWSEYEAREELKKLHPPSALDEALAKGAADLPPGEYEHYHLNSVLVLPPTTLGAVDTRFRPGNYLLCLRNANLLVILDRDTKKIVWSWGPGVLDYPHTPTITAGGRIVVFDNGTHRGWSRVIELDPVRKKIVWEYQGRPREEFFSAWRGSAQRLPNGNTLICQADSGRVFEVTPEKKIVWEYWNPPIEGKQHGIYRFSRLPLERVDKVLDYFRRRDAGTLEKA